MDERKIIKDGQSLESLTNSFDWVNILVTGFLFFTSLLTMGYLAHLREYPYIYDDEFGILGAAATFSGYDWSSIPQNMPFYGQNMPFYGFALSLIITPLFWISLEPTEIYRWVLYVNCFFLSLVVVMAWRIIDSLPFSCSRFFKLLTVISGFTYPSTLFYSQIAMGETILLFCFTAMVWLLTRCLTIKDTSHWNIYLLGFFAGLAPYAHSRGIVITVALGCTFVVAYRKATVKLIDFILCFISAILTYYLLLQIKAYLITKFYVTVRPGTGTITEFLLIFADKLNLTKILTILQVAFGQLTYLVTSSFGLIIAGFFALVLFTTMNYPVWSLTDSRKSQKQYSPSLSEKRAIAILAFFILLSIVLMYSASVVQMAFPVRGDQYFYGRYNDVMMPWLIIVSLLFLFAETYWRRLAWMLIGAAVFILMVYIISFYPVAIFNINMIWSSLPGWFVHIVGEWKIIPQIIAINALICWAGLLFAMFGSRSLFVLALITVFVFTFMQNFIYQHGGGDRAFAHYGKLGTIYKELFKYKKIYVYGLSYETFRHAEAVQFAFPNSEIVPVAEVQGICNNATQIYLDLKQNECIVGEPFYVTDKTAFCVTDTVLQNSIMKIKNSVSFTDYSMPTPAEKLEILNNDKGKIVVSASFSAKFLSFLAKFYYASWARNFLPSAEIVVSCSGLNGSELVSLGVFITDAKGKWVAQWREKININKLAHNGRVQVKVPIRLSTGLFESVPSGEYHLNFALVSNLKWDWRRVVSTNLIVS